MRPFSCHLVRLCYSLWSPFPWSGSEPLSLLSLEPTSSVSLPPRTIWGLSNNWHNQVREHCYLFVALTEMETNRFAMLPLLRYRSRTFPLGRLIVFLLTLVLSMSTRFTFNSWRLFFFPEIIRLLKSSWIPRYFEGLSNVHVHIQCPLTAPFSVAIVDVTRLVIRFDLTCLMLFLQIRFVWPVNHWEVGSFHEV